MASSKVKAHQIYRNKDNKIVPGVTTILGVLNKPALVKWANNLGLQGIDATKYRDEKADIGTLAHAMIQAHCLNKMLDVSEYSKENIDKAENSLISFYSWEKSHRIVPILVEESLVSEKYQYGGQIDLYCELDGEKWLVDFKTSKAIYSEMLHQLAAYNNLLTENGYDVDGARILRIGRDESEGFEERTVRDINKHFKIFKYCLKLYNLKKELKDY